MKDARRGLHSFVEDILGGSVSEREGSRVKIELNGEQWRCHRPHPGKDAKRYQVEEARELFERAGVLP
jgi:hypothetical protein